MKLVINKVSRLNHSGNQTLFILFYYRNNYLYNFFEINVIINLFVEISPTMQMLRQCILLSVYNEGYSNNAAPISNCPASMVKKNLFYF